LHATEQVAAWAALDPGQ
ncbi:hypothetical protein, partial [Glutamicibacter creatinolyticus]